MTYEICTDDANATDGDKYEVKSPSYVRKGSSGCLQVDEISERDSSHAETHAFRSDVVREELRVEDNTSNVNAHAVYCEKEIEPASILELLTCEKEKHT